MRGSSSSKNGNSKACEQAAGRQQAGRYAGRTQHIMTGSSPGGRPGERPGLHLALLCGPSARDFHTRVRLWLGMTSGIVCGQLLWVFSSWMGGRMERRGSQRVALIAPALLSDCRAARCAIFLLMAATGPAVNPSKRALACSTLASANVISGGRGSAGVRSGRALPAGGSIDLEGDTNGRPRGARENSYVRLDAESVDVMVIDNVEY
jgi:hypothetical protein